MDIHKPGSLDLLLPLDSAIQGLAKLRSALNQRLEPHLGALGLFGGAVVGDEARVGRLELDVAAGV